MKKSCITFIMIFGICSIFAIGKTNLDYSDQISLFANFSPDNNLNTLLVGRYIPQLVFSDTLSNSNMLDFEASVNIYGSASLYHFDSLGLAASISPYRLWGRYSGNQYEIRLGLQKIDFGSASLLRPLQWFNQIDPRDPLKITNGVYGALGRYYFLNNANVWAWLLYGNEKRRGLDALESNKKNPEFGCRFQQPIPKGEIALSYHHRTADASTLSNLTSFEKIPEDRIGLDGKWDLGVGLWFEAVYIHESKDIGNLTNQTLFNIGTDYTFGIGNGLYVEVEHLILNYDKKPFEFNSNYNITSSLITYPLGLDDNISSILNYSWNSRDLSFFLNYSHQFQQFMGYLMLYYNSETANSLQNNIIVNQFKGPGIQLMLVYNH